MSRTKQAEATMSDKPKWTPGPWRVGPSGLVFDARYTRKHAIAATLGEAEQADINARLIAAAPLMAEALQEAQRAIAALKTFCNVPLTVVCAAETEHRISYALRAAGVEP